MTLAAALIAFVLPQHTAKGAALEAVSRWRAEPARLNGAPIATSTVLHVRFK